MTENELNDMLKSETRKLKEINAFIKKAREGILKSISKTGKNIIVYRMVSMRHTYQRRNLMLCI